MSIFDGWLLVRISLRWEVLSRVRELVVESLLLCLVRQQYDATLSLPRKVLNSRHILVALEETHLVTGLGMSQGPQEEAANVALKREVWSTLGKLMDGWNGGAVNQSVLQYSKWWKLLIW